MVVYVWQTAAKEALEWVLIPTAADATYCEMAEQTEEIRRVSVVGDSTDRETSPLVQYSNSSNNDDNNGNSNGNKSNSKNVWDPRYRPALVAGIGLVFLQQLTGQPSVM